MTGALLSGLVSCVTPDPSLPTDMAWSAYENWMARPHSPKENTALNRETARLVEWYAALPEDQREAACRKIGLVVEIDGLPEQDLRQFLVAERVPRARLRNWHTRPGIGVPVVAWRANDGSGRHDSLRPPEGLACPMTAVLDRTDHGWRLRFLNPDTTENIVIADRKRPLAANFSAPIAFIAGRAEALRRSGFSGMINSTASARREKLYLFDPYDPDRIPLLMVHGLQSTPLAFANLSNDLAADPEFRKRYQIWHYHYPTGTPVLLNAAVFRHVLDRTLEELDPGGNDFATNNLVVLGHSMGGILTHTLTCDSQYKLWDAVIKVRPEKTSLRATPGKVTVNDVFLFRRDKRVRRVIFVAVPHRGSTLADNWIGDLGQSLFRGDREVSSAFAPLLATHQTEVAPFLARLLEERKLSSIRTLSGHSPALIALSKIRPAIPFHNIMGQTRPGPAEHGSDGVVTYASSRLDGAESELVVRSGHNAFEPPEAVSEIQRILRAHDTRR